MSYSFIASPNFYARISLFVFQSMSLHLLAHCRGCSGADGKRLDAGLLSVVISQEAERSVKVGFFLYSQKCGFNLEKGLFETNLSSGSDKAPC